MTKPDFEKIEEKIKFFWDENKIFKTKDLSDENIYSVDTPPPTVSGKMHIGHAFSYAQQDFIVRFQRMFKGNVFYPFGTDDNGLPTERLVEKLNKIKSKDTSRAEFVRLCLKTLKEIKPAFIQDWKDIGISCDYDMTYSTIDSESQKVSQESFVELYENGHIEKKSFPTIWCPECQTSIAQAELEDVEKSTKFSTLKFTANSKDLLIATTRPEMLAACVAVFVNPKDTRYTNLIGKSATVPIFGHVVPIIADDSAMIDKGTGMLMICSYGDKFDVEAIQRHKLVPKLIMEKNGCINAKGYDGVYVTKARKQILEELKGKDLIVEQKEMIHAVNTHDKCGTAIEFIDTPQWFIKIVDKKVELLKQGNKIKWYPEYMKKRYDNWVNGLDWDWSISRNRHFGIPIPAWECECGEIVVADKKDLPIDPTEVEKKCNKCNKKMKAETMVLDTWATSSASPRIASNLTGNKIKIPYALRPNAHDIIRTWAFYTIVKEYLLENRIPWNDIVISGIVSLKGEKMSKSKGNVIDPKDVIKDYSADCLRYWAAGSKLGADLDYNEKDLITGKKLINKILNASRFVFMNLENYNGRDKPEKLETIDKIFLNKIEFLIKRVTEAFTKYEYSKARKLIDDFFWNVFTDNYLEIVKTRVYQGVGDKKLSAQYALYTGLLKILKMWAPILPFITEEVYQENYKVNEKDESIHISLWPKNEIIEQEDLDELSRWVLITKIVSDVRKEKSNNKKPMNSKIILTLIKQEIELVYEMIDDLKNVTGAAEIKEGEFKVEFVE